MLDNNIYYPDLTGDVKSPVIFEDLICTNCGSENDFFFLNKWDKPDSTDVIRRAKCRKCGHYYNFKWECNEDGEYKYCLVDQSIKKLYTDFLNS